MKFDFTNKVALVTGSSRGIGKGIAMLLFKLGCKVILNSRNQKDLDMMLDKSNQNLLAVAADVTKDAGIKKIKKFMSKQHLTLDYLICNYGNGSSNVAKTYEISEWRTVFDVNFFSSINVLFAFINDLKKTNGSCIFISSICGFSSLDAPVPYSVSKSALNYTVKNLANSLGKTGVRINGISPGNILHNGSVWEKKLLENKKEVLKMIEKNVPLNKFGSPKDIASAVAFLLSDHANFITGSNLVIDGGQLRMVEV